MKRKGVTPLVGTALLIFIAISAMVSAGIFLRDTTQSVSQSVEDRMSEDRLIEESGLDIEHAYNDSNSINLVVRNTGTFTLQIEDDGSELWNVYVDGRPLDNWNHDGTDIIDPGESVTVQTGEEFPENDEFKSLRLTGSYETSSSIICDNTNGDGRC